MLRLAGARVRFFSSATRLRAATAFKMPAMSPTMTEGGVVEWKVAAGDSFAAGDILLDIETDKAQISVEAQDDGILAKILIDNGAEGVPVGKPIAVIAEPEDDVKSIDFDAVLAADSDSTKKESTKNESNSGSSDSARSAEPSRSEPKEQGSSKKDLQTDGGDKLKEGSVLPAATRLLHENGVSESAASSIKGTGPKGRILKGDVLAFLGRIDNGAPKHIKNEIKKKEHLDLSNIEKAEPKEKAKPAPPPKPLVWVRTIEGDDLAGIPAALISREVDTVNRLALRDVLLLSRPSPSSRRDATLDSLTRPKDPLEFSGSHSLKVRRGTVQSIQLEISFRTESPAAKTLMLAEAYLDSFTQRLHAATAPDAAEAQTD